MSKRHRLSRQHTATTFDARLAPALRVEPGDTVTFETDDSAYERYARGESVEAIGGSEAFNRVTGPLLVRGAKPGGALRIEVRKIIIRRAWAVWTPGFGPLGLFTDRVQAREVPIVRRELRVSERLSVPLVPTIGCVGVAPARGVGSTMEPAYHWGGNLDLRELRAGATLWLPVQVEGALLSLGDLHAAMGAGEPTWVGLEAGGEATVRVGIEEGMKLEGPRLRTGRETLFVVALGAARNLWEAKERATRLAYDYLVRERGLEPFEAYVWCCTRVDLRFGGPASPVALAAVPDPLDEGKER